LFASLNHTLISCWQTLLIKNNLQKNIFSVSLCPKNIPDIFDCNLKTNYLS